MVRGASYVALGLMSGTSADGIDVGLVRTNGEALAEPLGHAFYPYDAACRAAIFSAYHQGPSIDGPTARALELTLTQLHAAAVTDFLTQHADLWPDVIGFHGQTLWHRPPHGATPGATCQIGDGALLAQLTGIRVVNDFRSNDMRHGGHGAPLIPIWHQALLTSTSYPSVWINIGGVANCTVWDPTSTPALWAQDTGPGNALIDDWVRTTTGQPFDDNGALAKLGRVHQGLLDQWLAHPAFATLTPGRPHSLDRQAFSSVLRDCHTHTLSPEDGAATLTALTVTTLARAIPPTATTVIVSGGGARNATLMGGLQAMLPEHCTLSSSESLGWASDAIEAYGFGYLAVRSLRGLPLSFPATTGVALPLVGGVVHHPS